eukprot:SAG11_NODE_38_length_21705_cov_24.667453_9_plen_74_part_00
MLGAMAPMVGLVAHQNQWPAKRAAGTYTEKVTLARQTSTPGSSAAITEAFASSIVIRTLHVTWTVRRCLGSAT